MIDVKNIFPECDADTLLVELIINRGKPNHKKGISEVTKALDMFQNNNSRLVGLVDYDKLKYQNQNKYLVNFSEIILDQKNEDEGLIIKKIPNKQHFLIFVFKEFEPWIWKQAQLAKIDSTEFGIKNLDELYKLSKHYRNIGNANFKKFVNAVVSANPMGIELLRSYLIVN